MSGNILTLNAPMAPRLIRILYVIAIILIVLGVLRGVAGGVMTMMRPPRPATMMTPADQTAAQNTTQAPNMAMSAQPSPTPQNAQGRPMHRPGFGPRRFRRGPGFGGPGFGGPRFGMRGPMMMMRGMPPAVVGGVRILLALLHGFIVLLVVRVLAEIGIAVLAMGARAQPSTAL